MWIDPHRQERYHEHQWLQSSRKSCKRSVFLEQTDPLSELSVPPDWFFFKWEFWMILFKSEAILVSSSLKFRKSFPAIDRDDFNSPTESTISTSMIHNVASEGGSEQELTWVFESYLTIHKWWRCRELIGLELRLSVVCAVQPLNFVEFPLVRKNSWLTAFLQTSALGVVLLIRSSPLATTRPVLTCTGIAPVALGFAEWRIPC